MFYLLTILGNCVIYYGISAYDAPKPHHIKAVTRTYLAFDLPVKRTLLEYEEQCMRRTRVRRKGGQ